MTGLLFLAFVSTVYLANWAIVTFGLVPVGFGLMAPAGVWAAGLSFSIRDALSERAGRHIVLLAILVGGGLSAFLGGALALASGAAFLLSEGADWAVYSPLRRRGWVPAVVASNLVGATVDSWLFLTLAGFGTDLLLGMIVGKALMILPVLLVYGLLARRPSRALAR